MKLISPVVGSRLAGAALLSSVIIVQSSSASAEDKVADSKQAAKSDTESEPATIIVTARKKSERLVDTPISITAFTGEDLKKSGVTKLNDLAVRTPGLQYGNFGDEKLSPTSLRGIVADAGSAGADPAVGIYVDEVFVGQGAGASIDYFDLDRVEVLRGPQGTLFGRNTIGGVINISTVAPTRDFDAQFEGEVGNFGQLQAQGAIGGALVGDTVLGRFSFFGNHRNGVDHNVVLDRDVNSQKSWSARGQLLFNISDFTRWRVSADYHRVNQDSLVFETLSYDPNSTFVFAMNLFGAQFNTDPYDRDVYADVVTKEKLKSGGVSSDFRTQVGGVDIVDITSWRKHDYKNLSDTDRSPLRWIYDGDPEKGTSWSNELRASGKTGPVDWLLGGYYFHQKTNNLSFIRVGEDLATLLGDPSLAGTDAGSNAAMKTRSAALFGSATVKFGPRFDVTLGGRYTREHKSIDYSQADPLALLGGDFSTTASDSWGKFTPSVNARYHFSPDTIAYATVSEGFKSGGFNDALGSADGIAFNPEILWNYEAGFKTALLNRRVFVSAAAFYMKWTDIQMSIDNPNTPTFDPIIVNAGKAHSQGLEFEVTARAMKGLNLRANGTVLDAKYDAGTLPDGRPIDRIPFAPRFTLNLGGEYEVSLSSSFGAFFGGEVLVRGTSYLTPDNQADGRVPTYALVNLRAGIAGPNNRWRLTVWGKNVTDKRVKERLFDLRRQDLIGQKFIALNEPATYGATLSTERFRAISPASNSTGWT